MLTFRFCTALMVAATFAAPIAMSVAADQRRASPSAAEIQNLSFDATLGAITFDLVNNASSALTAYTYEIQYTNADGDKITGSLRSQDLVGAVPLTAGAESVGWSTNMPEDMLPIPPKGRRTFTEELGAGSTQPTVTVYAALFADGTSHGKAETVQQFKRERVKMVEHLGMLLAVLRKADKQTEPADVFAVLDAEAAARPAIRDSILETRGGLQQMAGDVHENLRNIISITDVQRNGVARGH